MQQALSCDFLSIGNAIVDMIAPVDQDYLNLHGLQRGMMTLIDRARAEALEREFPQARLIVGGAASNTAVGVASLGGRSGFIGKLGDDSLGQVFAKKINDVGVSFNTHCETANNTPTARSTVLVTPDTERTMLTYLGAAQMLSPSDLDPERMCEANIVLLEAYLLDAPQGQAIFERCFEIVKTQKTRIAVSLSDAFCVERHRDYLRGILDGRVAILIANESEGGWLYDSDDFNTTLQHARHAADIVVLTRSEKGAVITSRTGEAHVLDAIPVDNVVDVTGAGDMFAAGVLFGLIKGYDLDRCGRIGLIAAAENISHYGSLPEVSLAMLI